VGLYVTRLYLLLKRFPLLERQAVRLGNNRHHVDNFAQLLHYDDINGTERMPCGTDKVKTAMNACVLNVAVTHGRELLAEVRAVLVLDVLHNGIPAGPT